MSLHPNPNPNRTTALPPVDARPIDWELLLCTHVLGLESLHWGLWDPECPLTLDGLRRAQERYTELVMEVLPRTVHTVLDVGCGTGDLAERLAARGCRVTAIAPIANYEHRLSTNGRAGIRWKQTRLQDLQGEGPFDAVLMIESAGYFPVFTGLEKARDLLVDGGYLLVANPFRTADVDLQVARHTLDDYLATARWYGFSMVTEMDITDEVLPTLALARHFRTRHMEPALSLLRYAAHRSRPVRIGLDLATMLFRRRIRSIRAKMATLREQMDPDLFGEHARYMVLLFRNEF